MSLCTLATIAFSIDEELENLLLCVVVNGERVGVATASTIISVARRMAARKESAALIVHSLLGHSADFVAALAKAAQTAANYWWLHDYFSICPNYTLLRNGASFCGAPPVSSLACNICCFGDDRRFQGQRIQRLFEDVSFSVLSPSEVTLDIWKHSSKLPHSSATIVPHCAVSDVIIDRRLPIPSDAPIRVAFVGYPARHKGWQVFEEIVNQNCSRSDVEFHYFGVSEISNSCIERHQVRVTKEHVGAMSRALLDNDIDVAIIWASGPETFSFTTHEAMQAGVMLLVSSTSGNITRVVEKCSAGRIFNGVVEIEEYFKSPGFIDDVRAWRGKPRGMREIVYSTLTFDMVSQKVKS